MASLAQPPEQGNNKDRVWVVRLPAGCVCVFLCTCDWPKMEHTARCELERKHHDFDSAMVECMNERFADIRHIIQTYESAGARSEPCAGTDAHAGDHELCHHVIRPYIESCGRDLSTVWREDVPFHQWEGIILHREARGDEKNLQEVHGIDMSNWNIGAHLGTLVRHVAALRSVRMLNVSGNASLSGVLSAVCALPDLVELRMDACRGVVGHIGCMSGLYHLQTLDLNECTRVCGDVAALSALSSLRVLHLGNTCVGGHLSSLQTLAQLRVLDLHHTTLKGELSCLAALTNLTALCITSPDLNAPHVLADALSHAHEALSQSHVAREHADGEAGPNTPSPQSTLTHTAQHVDPGGLSLSLAGEVVNDLVSMVPCVHSFLSDLAPLHSLESLVLQLPGLRGDIGALADLTHLRALDLTSCSHVTGDVTALGNLENLEVVSLGGTAIFGSVNDVKPVLALRALDLQHCSEVRGEIHAFLDIHKHLSPGNVHVQGTQIADAGGDFRAEGGQYGEDRATTLSLPTSAYDFYKGAGALDATLSLSTRSRFDPESSLGEIMRCGEHSQGPRGTEDENEEEELVFRSFRTTLQSEGDGDNDPLDPGIGVDPSAGWTSVA